MDARDTRRRLQRQTAKAEVCLAAFKVRVVNFLCGVKMQTFHKAASVLPKPNMLLGDAVLQNGTQAGYSVKTPDSAHDTGAGSATGTTPVKRTGADGRGAKVRALLRARLGDDVFTSWFNALEFEDFDGQTVKVSVPVKFLRNWIQSHFLDDLLLCCRSEFEGAENIDVVLRQPGSPQRVAASPAAPADG